MPLGWGGMHLLQTTLPPLTYPVPQHKLMLHSRFPYTQVSSSIQQAPLFNRDLTRTWRSPASLHPYNPPFGGSVSLLVRNSPPHPHSHGTSPNLQGLG